MTRKQAILMLLIAPGARRLAAAPPAAPEVEPPAGVSGGLVSYGTLSTVQQNFDMTLHLELVDAPSKGFGVSAFEVVYNGKTLVIPAKKIWDALTQEEGGKG